MVTVAAKASSYEKLADAQRILLVNPRGLGDVVHSLPSAAMIKALFPQAKVDFFVSEHSAPLCAIVPSISQTLSVPFYPRPRNRWERYGRRLQVARQIRRNDYDAIINLQAIDSTLASIALSRARYKLAIRSLVKPIGMRWFYSDVAERPWRNQSAYRFLLENLGDAGFDVGGWHIGPGLLDLSGVSLPAEIRQPFFHFSPFASKVSRQIPHAEARAMISGLLQRYPEHQLVVSCANVERETAAIAAMIPPMFENRVQVFPGTLDLAQLTLVLSRCAAHFGPDTGSLHLAWLAGARTVSWFLNHESMMAWVPYGPQHRILLSLREQVRIGDNDRETEEMPIQCVKAHHILDAVDELLTADLGPPDQWPASEHLGFRCVY